MVQATGKGPGWKAEARGGKYIPTAARSYVLGKAAGQKNLSKYSRGGKNCRCLLPVTCFSKGISTDNIYVHFEGHRSRLIDVVTASVVRHYYQTCK